MFSPEFPQPDLSARLFPRLVPNELTPPFQGSGGRRWARRRAVAARRRALRFGHFGENVLVDLNLGVAFEARPARP